MKRSFLVLSAFLGFTYVSAQTTVLEETFNNGIPASWTLYNDSNLPDADVSEYTDAWISIENPDSPGDSVASSTSYFDPTGQADRWLITPKFTLGPGGNFIKWKEKSVDPSFPDAYTVIISKTDSLKESFTDTIANVIGANPTWLEREFNLSDFGFDNESIFVAFVCNSDNKFKLMIDSVLAVKDSPVGINELEIETFDVFPNPSSDFINIPFGIEAVSIYDMSGRLVLNSNDQIVSITNLRKGIYVVDAQASNGVVKRSRFVKE